MAPISRKVADLNSPRAVAAVIVSLCLTLTLVLTLSPGVMSQSTNPPDPPTGLTGTVSHYEVALSWDDPDDSTITGYQILRRDRAVDGPGVFNVHVDDTGSSRTSYVDTDVEPEARYVYRVKARNADGLSTRSNYFNANIPLPVALAQSEEPTEPSVPEAAPDAVSNLAAGSAANQVALGVGQAYAQQFTTGGTDAGVKMIRLYLRGSGDSRPTVTIRADSCGRPAETLATFRTPRIDSTTSTHEDFWLHSSSASGRDYWGIYYRLRAFTSYWVVVERPVGTGSFTFSITDSHDESIAYTGWSLTSRVFSGPDPRWNPVLNAGPHAAAMRVAVYFRPS